MKCDEIQKLLPIFLDEALEADEMQSVESHVKDCKACQKELAAYKASWEMLGDVEEIQPSANYISRFWTEVSQQKKWYEKLGEFFKETFLKKRLAPSLAAICMVVIISGVLIHNYSNTSQDPMILVSKEGIDIEMVENIELAENFEIIQDLEFFEDWEVIESLDV